VIKDIISLQNSIVKEAAELNLKKYRSQRGEFLVEGVRAVQEATTSGWEVTSIFFDDSIPAAKIATMVKNSVVPCYHVSHVIIERIADTKNPQGIVAIIKARKDKLADLAEQKGLILVLDEVRDPGNVGTIIRAADAAGAAGVILLNACADLYSPKVVRSAMGSIFHVPIITDVEKKSFCEWCSREKWELWVTSLDNGVNIYEIDWTEKVAVVMGNEANGASEEMLRAAKKNVYIPMGGKAESLNVAIAAGVFLFEGVHKQALATK